ncbi:GNAT family N-acetyltransferase, partial [Enterococcus faecalis]
MELRETKCGILCLLDREELKKLNQKEVKKTDYPQLISLWRSSVEGTHLLL